MRSPEERAAAVAPVDKEAVPAAVAEVAEGVHREKVLLQIKALNPIQPFRRAFRSFLSRAQRHPIRDWRLWRIRSCRWRRGTGGNGGAGATGGSGGGGGGAFEIIAQGKIDVGGSLHALGGSGMAGDIGTAGSQPTQAGLGEIDDGDIGEALLRQGFKKGNLIPFPFTNRLPPVPYIGFSAPGGAGGDGGDGGVGGKGGDGGDGGAGAGGGGGTVKLVGTSVFGTGSVNTSADREETAQSVLAMVVTVAFSSARTASRLAPRLVPS